MNSFTYGTTTFTYSIEYMKKKKDISLSVALGEGIKVVAPEGIETNKIHSILYKKAPWILKKKTELEEIADKPSAKEFVSGEKFPYLGRHYRLKVHRSDHLNLNSAKLKLKQGRFIADVPDDLTEIEKTNQLHDQFKRWYIHHGTKKVKERLKIYCPKMGLEPTKIIVKEQQKRWGTCTGDGAIYLNWKLMMAPMAIIDYVIVHELAHLKYPDHSHDYWQFVRSILPDYKQRKEWLRINGTTLSL